MLKKNDIVDFINRNEYDMRKTKNSRWIDQKCTPDVICIIAEAALEFTEKDNSLEFNKTDIWRSDFSIEQARDCLKKSDSTKVTTKNEYNKLYSQPLLMLASANVLEDVNKTSNRHKYVVKNRDVLEFISMRTENALFFLQNYIEKVLVNSDMNN